MLLSKRTPQQTLTCCQPVMLSYLLTNSTDTEKYEHPVGVNLLPLLRKHLLDAQLGYTNTSFTRPSAVSGEVTLVCLSELCALEKDCLQFVLVVLVMSTMALKYIVLV